MKKLILLTIALAITSTAYADVSAKYMQRDKYDYYCSGGNDFYRCAYNLKEGDLLLNLTSDNAVRYCDQDELILDSKKDYGLNIYDCIYNGRKVKDIHNLINIKKPR